MRQRRQVPITIISMLVGLSLVSGLGPVEAGKKHAQLTDGVQTLECPTDFVDVLRIKVLALDSAVSLVAIGWQADDLHGTTYQLGGAGTLLPSFPLTGALQLTASLGHGTMFFQDNHHCSVNGTLDTPSLDASPFQGTIIIRCVERAPLVTTTCDPTPGPDGRLPCTSVVTDRALRVQLQLSCHLCEDADCSSVTDVMAMDESLQQMAETTETNGVCLDARHAMQE